MNGPNNQIAPHVTDSWEQFTLSDIVATLSSKSYVVVYSGYVSGASLG